LIGEFKKDHPAAVFDVDTKATGYGLAALRAGLCDIAGASREANREEIQAAQSYHVQLNNYLFGYYSVAVTVNANNPVANLTKKQVRDIFTGAVRNWKDVGGPDAAINLYIRDPISGTYLGFREIAMDNKPYAAGAKLMTNYTGIVEALAQDANGVGYSSIELATNAGVKAVSIEGIAPTAQTVNAGKYLYARPLRFYTNKAKESGTVHEFIQFVESPKGQQILARMGFVPHS
jgi:phosphate transport system substrate-binding protein